MAVSDISTSLFLGSNTGLEAAEGSILAEINLAGTADATLNSAFDSEITASAAVLAQSPTASVQQTSLAQLFANRPDKKHLQAVAASAAFAATTFFSSAAMASGAGIFQNDFNLLWTFLALSPALAETLHHRLKVEIFAEWNNLTPANGMVLIDGREFISFDSNAFQAAVASGNKELDEGYARLHRIDAECIIGGLAIVPGGLYLMWTSSGFLSPHWLHGFAAMAFGNIIHRITSRIIAKRIRENYSHARKQLENAHLGLLIDMARKDTESVTTKKIAGWVNVVHEAAERATAATTDDQKNLLSLFESVLKTGLRVADKQNDRLFNYVELMGQELVDPFVNWALESPNGVKLFQILARYNSLAEKMEKDTALMRNRVVHWKVEHLFDPNALETMRWLVERGNIDILKFVEHWKDGGHQQAIDLWNQFHGIAPAPAPAPSQVQPPSRILKPFDAGKIDSLIRSELPVELPVFAPEPATALIQPESLDEMLAHAYRIEVPDLDAEGDETGQVQHKREELQVLEGQRQVLEWLKEMWALLMVEKVRSENGHSKKTSLHAAFSGPEGVGKHRAALMYEEILKKVGRVSDQIGSGKLLVVEVAEFTNRDPGEAHKRAEELAKEMAATDGVVVISGTNDEVQAFLKTFPEVAKSVKHNVRFNELNGGVLSKILEKLANEEGFELTDAARVKMERVLKDKRGGSNIAIELLERAIKNLSKRLAPEIDEPSFDKARLTLLEAADFANDYRVMETAALEKLEKMIGLGEVKSSLNRIVAMLKQNRQREMAGLDATKPSLHATFVGNPGTGKTTVAEIYAEALKGAGYLSKGQLVKSSPAELVGDVIGATERKVLAKLEEARGGVLFIDEAHNFISSESGAGDFGKTALKTILKYMEDHRDEIVVIFAGYPEQIEKLLDADPGLRRRFTEKIKFADYSLEELGQILDYMVAGKSYTLSVEARKAAVELLDRQRSGKDFGNAGAVRNLFEAAVLRQSERLGKAAEAGQLPTKKDLQSLTAADFEGESAPDPQNALRELDGFVGLAKVKEQFGELQTAVEFNRSRGGDPKDWFEPGFLFAGPPGTGKTSVAGVLGRFFHGLGLLPDSKVVAVSATDLIASFVGQTSDQTKKIIESALGGVLFIDEIGGLAKSAGGFAKDAVNQLLTLSEKYRGRLVIVVAGYDEEINAFLNLDAGLSSRFAKRFAFESLTAEEATDLFATQMEKARPSLKLSEEAKPALPNLMRGLRLAPQWASGRDIRTLVNETIAKQARAWAKDREKVDINLISAEVLRKAVAALIQKKTMDHGLGTGDQRRGGGERFQYAAAEAEAPLPLPSRTAARADVDVKTLKALGVHVETAVETFHLTAEQAKQQLTSGDPNSALAQEIAKKTGQDAKTVAEELKKMAEAIAAQPKELGWICIYCGNSNPDCPYKGRPDRDRFNALTRK